MSEPEEPTPAVNEAVHDVLPMTSSPPVVVRFARDELTLIARALRGVGLSRHDLVRVRDLGETLESRAQPEMNLLWINWPDQQLSFDVYLRPRPIRR